MLKPKKLLLFSYIFLLSLCSFLSADETLTITTYYPSPYGSYQDLYVANSLSIGTTSPQNYAALDVNTTGYKSIHTMDNSNGGLLIGYMGSTIQARTTTDDNNQNLILQGWGGNVGIGTTSPTAQFEVVCPAGFTNIKAGDNQLGCMETAEHGTGTYTTAVNTCFTAYGGRLPTSQELYMASNNYTLTGETDNYERVSDAYSCYPGDDCHIIANFTAIWYAGDGGVYAYRCWIPR